MSSNQSLTYNRQGAHLHLTRYHDQTSSSAPTPTPLSRSQPSGDSDLFTTLLLDRQRAYQRPPNTLLASHFSPQSKVRDATSATQSLQSKHGSQATIMPPKTRCMSRKQKRQVKGNKVTKTRSAKPDTKPAESRVAMSPKIERETASQEGDDVVMVSLNEEEAHEIQQLCDELEAANARIKQLEDLLETKQTTCHTPSIEQSLTKESAPLQVTSNQKKPIALTLQVQPQLPLTPQSPTQSVPPVSPYPSSISTIFNEEDLKLENVRAIYAKVKTKLDTLNVIARKLDWCTKSMDLSHFGEFGAHMKQLREWLEEDEQKQQQQRQQQK